MAFDKVDPKVDFPTQERAILAFWEETNAFDKLREMNKGKPKWSFLDGPITANNPMGVHHAWGRTYKDVFHRYHAAKGHDMRYQNGFDCQGLWIEVEVEKERGFKNKKDIEAYGVGKFVDDDEAFAITFVDGGRPPQSGNGAQTIERGVAVVPFSDFETCQCLTISMRGQGIKLARTAVRAVTGNQFVGLKLPGCHRLAP